MKANLDRCPCCGTLLFLADGFSWNKLTTTLETPYGNVQLTHLKARMFDLIWRAKPNRIPIARLVDVLWGHDKEGGPDQVENQVRVCASQLRKIIAPFGAILMHGEKGNGGYSLILTTPEQAKQILQKIRHRSGWQSI